MSLPKYPRAFLKAHPAFIGLDNQYFEKPIIGAARKVIRDDAFFKRLNNIRVAEFYDKDDTGKAFSRPRGLRYGDIDKKIT